MKKKNLFMVAIAALFLSIGLTSCKKDKDKDGDKNNVSKIVASNVQDVPDKVEEVRAVSYVYNEDEDNSDDVVLVKAPYKNNGFVLEMPSAITSQYLEPVYEFLEEDENIKISDKNAKILLLEDINAYNSKSDEDDDYVGWFYLEDEKDDVEYYTSWMYSDRDVTIKGIDVDDEYKVEMDLKLKKGWNIIYDSYSDNTETYTSIKPSGINYSWIYYEDYGRMARKDLSKLGKKSLRK